MALVNDPTRGTVRNVPGFFQQQAARQQQQQLSQAQIQNIMSQIALRNAQAGQIGQPEQATALDDARRRLLEAQTGQVGKTAPPSALDVARTQKTIAETGQIGQPAPASALDIARTDLIKGQLGKLGKPSGTLKDRLGAKVAGGTATDNERNVFDQLAKTAQTTISIGDQKVTTNSLALNKTFKSDIRIKDMRIIEKFTQNMVTALKRSRSPGFTNFGPTDITLAKSFQKLTDLGSTVREGEFATTFEGQTLINKVRGKIQSMLSGGLGFTQEDRKELVDLALALQEDSKKLFNQAIVETSATSDELGLNTRAVLGGVKPFTFDEPQQPGIVKVFATNPKTGKRIQSTDGGKTWQPAQ